MSQVALPGTTRFEALPLSCSTVAGVISESAVADDFDWQKLSGDERVVNEARETAVYLNPQNDVVIRQRANWPDENEDPFLVIPLYRVQALIDRLDALLLEAHRNERRGDHESNS
jgi:hypothetical protein